MANRRTVMADCDTGTIEAAALQAIVAAVPAGSKGDKGDKGDIGSPGPSWQFGIGDVFLSTTAANPGIRLGYGTWVQIAGGRMLIGQGNAPFDVAGNTGGASSVTLTTNELPVHTHVQNSHVHTEQLQGGTTGTTTGTNIMGSAATGGTLRSAAQSSVAATAVNQNAGSGASFSVLNPYLVVYVWKRTA